MFKVIIFIIISITLAWISRASLRVIRSHGFYRFFAWEFITALVLLNLEYWFRNPFSANQLISWLLLLASLFVLAHGVHLLHVIGRPNSKKNLDAPLLGFEKTTALVTVGAYRYIRHRLYASLLYLAWGVFLKDPVMPALALTVAATLFLVATAKFEEAENAHLFGIAYEMYKNQTKMFVPFLF